VNDLQCRLTSGSGKSPLRRRPGWRALWLAALLVSPVPALAQLALTTMADTQYEYNSNVFALQSGSRTPFGGTSFGDTDLSYGGELDASYLLGQQQFYATLLGNEYHYDRFQELNHSDDTLIGGWDWKVGRIWDGIIDVEHIRSMVSFWNVIGTSLVVQTEQRETGRASVQATPDWRAEFTGLTHKIDQPQIGAPNLSVTESSGTVGIKYTGTAGLTAGVDGSYLKGSFHDTGPNLEPGYSQESGGLTATDEVTGLSTFRGQLGYTRRSSDSGHNSIFAATTGGTTITGVTTGGNSISAVTGDLDYKRNLTGKTRVEVDLSRQINIYVATSTSEIDSIATLSANWQATYKIDVLLGYTFTYRQLPQQGNEIVGGVVVLNGTTQTQRLHSPTLTVTYEPFRWLVLKPYFNYQTRASENFVGGDFNSTLVGMRFTLQWEHGVVAPRTPIYNYN
jgi:hypothetical protein